MNLGVTEIRVKTTPEFRGDPREKACRIGPELGDETAQVTDGMKRPRYRVVLTRPQLDADPTGCRRAPYAPSTAFLRSAFQ